MKFLVLVFILFTYGSQPTASYDIEPELFWIKKYKLIDISTETQYASTIYYEPISQKFYFASIQKTNNISYSTNHINDEKAFITYTACWGARPNQNDTDLIYYPIEDPLKYIGSLTFSERIYIDTNKQLYLKILTEMDTSYYMDYNDNKQLQKGQLFPYLEINKQPTLALSNQFEEYFIIGNLRPNTSITNGIIFLKYWD